jgi:hypothetical protein
VIFHHSTTLSSYLSEIAKGVPINKNKLNRESALFNLATD